MDEQTIRDSFCPLWIIMMTVYILTCKPDLDQLLIANYCIFQKENKQPKRNMLGLLDLKGLRYWGKKSKQNITGAGKFDVTEFVGFLGLSKLSGRRCITWYDKPRPSGTPSRFKSTLKRIMQLLLDRGLSHEPTYPLLCHKFVPRTGGQKNKNPSGSLLWYCMDCKQTRLLWRVRMSEVEKAHMHTCCVRACAYGYTAVGKGPCGAEMVRFAFISNYLMTDKWKDFFFV